MIHDTPGLSGQNDISALDSRANVTAPLLPSIARGSHDSSDFRGSFIRMTMTWWSSRGLIMPSHMRYHSRRGQWSPCSKVLLLIWCHWLHDDWKKYSFDEKFRWPDEKQQNPFRQTEWRTHGLKFQDVFACQWWWMVLTWLSVFSKYSCTQGSADVNGLPRIFLFLKTRKEKNWPEIFSAC